MGSDAILKDTLRIGRDQEKVRYIIGGAITIAVLLSVIGYFAVRDVRIRVPHAGRGGGVDDDIAHLEQLSKKLHEAQKELDMAIESRKRVERDLTITQRALKSSQLINRAEVPTGSRPRRDGSEEEASFVVPGKGHGFALTTAFEGEKYDIMGALASDTKAKYAALHGYAYYLDNDLLSHSMSFQEKSGSRIACFRRHWDDYDWLIWTDADVLITNPAMRLEEIVETHAPPGSGIHVLMSKDWGGRQVNPGVTFLKTTPEGKKFLDRWEAEIKEAKYHDDLLAIKQGMEPKGAEELRYLRFVPQHVLNSYPSDELKYEPYNSTTIEHNTSHEFWEPGHLFIHVVNCLRQVRDPFHKAFRELLSLPKLPQPNMRNCEVPIHDDPAAGNLLNVLQLPVSVPTNAPAMTVCQSPHKLDSQCCNGIAARYWYEFTWRLEKVLQEHPAKRTSETLDWTEPFKANLCLK